MQQQDSLLNEKYLNSLLPSKQSLSGTFSQCLFMMQAKMKKSMPFNRGKHQCLFVTTVNDPFLFLITAMPPL